MSTAFIADWESLPDSTAGVYFMFRGKRIVYIGQSKNLTQRLYNHKLQNGIRSGNLKVAVILLPDLTQRNFLERCCISFWKPKYNHPLTYSYQIHGYGRK